MCLAFPFTTLTGWILWNSTPGMQFFVVYIATQGGMAKKANLHDLLPGEWVWIQVYKGEVTAYLPSSRAAVMGWKVKCDRPQIKVPFLQASSSSREETAVCGRHLWGRVAPKATGRMENMQFIHRSMLELHQKLPISFCILKLWILNCSYVRSEKMWTFPYLWYQYLMTEAAFVSAPSLCCLY